MSKTLKKTMAGIKNIQKNYDMNSCSYIKKVPDFKNIHISRTIQGLSRT